MPVPTVAEAESLTEQLETIRDDGDDAQIVMFDAHASDEQNRNLLNERIDDFLPIQGGISGDNIEVDSSNVLYKNGMNFWTDPKP